MSKVEDAGWEYCMKEFDPSDTTTVELWLNLQGTAGWELVSVMPSSSGKGIVAFMKRPRWTKEEGFAV